MPCMCSSKELFRGSRRELLRIRDLLSKRYYGAIVYAIAPFDFYIIVVLRNVSIPPLDLQWIIAQLLGKSMNGDLI